MYNNSKIAKAVRLAMIFGAASAATISTQAFSADEENADEIEKIEVTGSRIKRTDMETAQPVTVIDRAALEASGLTSVGDFLQNLPMAGSAINTTFNNGGDGSTRVDLRNLGSSRVLVLVNGRRWIASGTGANGSVDLNTIPTTVIKRIEVLKDGAGAVYGSDAIAGVVNIITRDDFEGVELNAYYGKSKENDGEQQQYDMTIGTASEKGHVTFNVSYTKQEPIMAGDREISAVPQFGTGNRLGSSATPQGRFAWVDYDGTNYRGFVNHSVSTDFDPNNPIPGPQVPFLPDGSVNPNSQFTPFSNELRFNYAPQNYLLTPQDRWSLYVNGGYEITDSINLTTEVLYNHRESSQLLAPMPLFIGPWAGGAQALNPTVISAENIYNPFSYDIFGEEHLAFYNGGFIGRRFFENGERLFSQRVDTWKLNAGLDGSFEIGDNTWDWSVYFGYGNNQATSTTEGRLNMARIAQALSAECNTDPSCVPLNLFGGLGSITQDMLDYVTTTETSTGGNKSWNYAANISGTPIALPAGDLGVAAGYEYRRETGYNSPDYLVQSGQSSGGAQLPTKGGFKENSYYLEIQAPLVADADFVKSLDLTAAVRYTSIENTVGVKNSNTSTSTGLTWRMNDDLLIRGNYSTGFRTPSISNLFGGLSVTYPDVNDPCNSAGDGSVVCSGVPTNYTQPNSQLEAQVGANENLEPETSTSISYGIVYNPSYIDGLDMSIDIWDVEIENVITSAGFQQVLNTCSDYDGKSVDDATHPIAGFCNQLLTRAPSGVPVTFINPLLNSGKLITKGVDFDISYNIESNIGEFRFVLDATYTDDYHLENDNGDAQPNQAGRNLGDTGLPRWKSNFTLTWSMDDFSVNYRAQMIGKQTEYCGLRGQGHDRDDSSAQTISEVQGTDTWICSDYDTASPRSGSSWGENKLGTVVYHDIQASYFLDMYDMRFTLGVNNVFDKVPPISTQAFANSFDASLYDPTGRFFYGRVSVKF